MSESTIKCENCEEEFTDKEAYESHRELSHENDSFQFIDSRDAVDEQEFVRINGKREYNPNPNAGLYDNKLFREGSAKERTSILGEAEDQTKYDGFGNIDMEDGFSKGQWEEIQADLDSQDEYDRKVKSWKEQGLTDDEIRVKLQSGEHYDGTDHEHPHEEATERQPVDGNDYWKNTYILPTGDDAYARCTVCGADVDTLTTDGDWMSDKEMLDHYDDHVSRGQITLYGESLDEEQSEDYLEARDELIADAIGSERLGSKNPFKIGNEFGDTYTCSYCGKVGTDFVEMTKEICPENPPVGQNGHQIPILGDESKANEDEDDYVITPDGRGVLDWDIYPSKANEYEEEDYDQRDQSELETDTSYEDEIYGGNSGNPDNWYQTEDGNWEVIGDGESYAKEDDYQHNFDELTSLAQDKIEDGGISQDTWDGSSKEERKDIESELHGESEDVDYEKEDELSAGFIEQQHTEPKEDKNKDLDDVDISLEKIDYVYPTKVGEAKKKSYVTEAIDGLDEEYNHEEPSDEEEIVDLVTARKMSGFSDESIARELHITYGVDPDYARNRVCGIEVSTNDKVANTFFGKMYRECTESEKDELKMYSGSDY